ncbi:MAG TPA: LytR C-terminal domain-containing protein [Solirubrobacteraceae bacterium]|nr:LytR C-terminal domain-containing protein [Solirubrobacteraceae bacterium]
MPFVLAFSLQGEVEKYGAYIGIASFIGLALLSVLYFSQAREVRRLRDWAGRAPERDRDLEQRVSAQADEQRRAPVPVRRPVAEPVTLAAAGAAVAAEAGAEAPGPAAVPRPANGRKPGPAAVPMGPRPATAAAAVAAAVSAVAAPAKQEEAAQAAEPEVEPEPTSQPAAEPAAAPVAATAASAELEGTEAPAEPAEPAQATPPPAETNGHGDQETGESAVAEAIPRATPRQGAQQRRPAQPLRQPQRSATPGQRRQTPPPRRRPPAKVQPAPSRSRGGHTPSRGVLLGALAGLIVVAVAALFATGVIGGGSGGNQPASQNAATPSPTAKSGGGTPAASSSRPASSAASRAAATVVVLNGTTVNGLAAGEKTKLEQLGYKDVQTTNSTNQAEQQSTVTYASGERRQAMDVAKALSISSVTPLDTDTQSLANNSFAKPVQADVVVIVGADQSP